MLVWITFALLALYLVILKWISLRSHSRSRPTVEDFFLVGRSLQGPLLWATILATVVNSLAFTAVPGLVYTGGVLFAQMWVIVLVLPILIRFFGPLISRVGYRKKAITQAEVYGRMYDSRSLALVCAIIGILSIFPFLTIQLSAIAKVAVIASKGFISYEVAIAVFALSTAFYLFFGGARAVVWTDVLQGLCFFLLLAAGASLCMYWVGGFGTAFSVISEARPELFAFSTKSRLLFLNNILSWPFAFFLWPQLFQRMLMAKDEEAIRRSSLATFLLFAVVMFCIMTVGIMATATFLSGEVAADTLLASMFAKHLPLAGTFLVLAVVASGMSTLDSGLLAVSSTIQRDFGIDWFRHRPLAAAKLISLGAISLLAILACSEFGRGAIAPLVTLGASFATLLLWPLLGIRLGWAADAESAIVAIVLGAIAILVSVFTAWGQQYLPGPGVSGFFSAGFVYLSLMSVRRVSSSLLPFASTGNLWNVR